MSERNESHERPGLDGHFEAKQADVDETLADPADQNPRHMGDISEDSRDEVERIADSNRDGVERAVDSGGGRGDGAANGAEGEH